MLQSPCLASVLDFDRFCKQLSSLLLLFRKCLSSQACRLVQLNTNIVAHFAMSAFSPAGGPANKMENEVRMVVVLMASSRSTKGGGGKSRGKSM